MKVKTINYAKIAITLFILLTTTISGFSQSVTINVLEAQKEHEKTITLTPYSGTGDDVTFLISVKWNNEDRSIKVDFKSKDATRRYIYSFPVLMFYKNVMKSEKETWFDKKLIKTMKDKTVLKSIDENTLENVRLINVESSIKVLDVATEDQITFHFIEQTSNGDACKIPMTLYVATRDFKGKKFKKVEYQAKLTLNITLNDICENPDIKNVVTSLDTEIGRMETQKKTITTELENLPKQNCSKIKSTSEKKTIKEEEKFSGIKNQQYSDCENLKTALGKHNETIDEINSLIRSYNAKLNEMKKECPGGGGGSGGETPVITETSVQTSITSCDQLEQVTKKLLGEIYFPLSNKTRTDINAAKQEYEEIKRSANNATAKKCKEYKEFEKACNMTEKLLK